MKSFSVNAFDPQWQRHGKKYLRTVYRYRVAQARLCKVAWNGYDSKWCGGVGGVQL